MSPQTRPSQWVSVPWRGTDVRLEYRWLTPATSFQPYPATNGAKASKRPLIVFLHEGLGSVSQWRDFPQALCEATGLDGLVYSRPGYGASDPHPDGLNWTPRFMHHEAQEVLPALLDTLGITQPIVPLGHSDGGSIAMLFVAQHAWRVAACVVLAPHLFVEACTRAGIVQVQQQFAHGRLRQALAAHHRDPEAALTGWSRVWLSEAFGSWNIEADLGPIRCPLLALQGAQDGYGTLQQLQRLAKQVAHTQWLELPDCGHAPHRDQRTLVLAHITSFLSRHLGNLR